MGSNPVPPDDLLGTALGDLDLGEMARETRDQDSVRRSARLENLQDDYQIPAAIMWGEADTSSEGEEDDEQVGRRSPQSRNKVPPPVPSAAFKESDFQFSTLEAAGMLEHNRSMANRNLTQMLTGRETGLRSPEGFSVKNKSRITNTFLPNEMRYIDSYHSNVFVGIYSDNGRYLITAAQDSLIRLYAVEQGDFLLIRTIPGIDIRWSILDLAFSSDNKHFVYSTWSPILHECAIDDDSETQRRLQVRHDHTKRFCLFSVVYSPDGNEIICGANDAHIYIFDRCRGCTIFRISAHRYDVNSVAFADISTHIFYSGSDDSLIKVWDRRLVDGTAVHDHSVQDEERPVAMLGGHRDGITFICSRGDGRHLISNSKDQKIKLWDVRRPSQMDYRPNPMLCGFWDYRWEDVPSNMYKARSPAFDDASLMTYWGHMVTRTLIRCRFSPMATTGQRYIYTGCSTGRLYIYDALTGKVKRNIKRHENVVRDVSWHPYQNEIVTSSWDKWIACWFYNCKSAGSHSIPWTSEGRAGRVNHWDELHR